jgi:hypothetical protein
VRAPTWKIERLVERWIIPHPFCCDNAMCRNPITRHGATTQIPGTCADHPRHGFDVPITIYGYAGEGWSNYPLGAGAYAALVRRGAFDDDGRTRPVAAWVDPPAD